MEQNELKILIGHEAPFGAIMNITLRKAIHCYKYHVEYKYSMWNISTQCVTAAIKLEDKIKVRTKRKSSACGVDLQVGEEYLISGEY
ncbi:hypothetical protein AM593_01671, partial [Mytilus galloprovincialis]